MDRKVILEKIGLIVGNFPEVEAAYVFGSFMDRDDFRDIDVALLISEKLSPYRALKLAMHIGRELDFGIKIGHDFDVRVLNNSHPEFQYEVVKTGVAVFSRNEQKRFDYEADVISTYLDLKEMYDFFDREYLARA
jgi:predicted nucleotidyltransferase